MESSWTHWHLTPRGWERGSSKPGEGIPAEIPTPNDCVLTWLYRQDGIYPQRPVLRELWRSPDAALVERLLAKYGPAPEMI